MDKTAQLQVNMASDEKYLINCSSGRKSIQETEESLYRNRLNDQKRIIRTGMNGIRTI